MKESSQLNHNYDSHPVLEKIHELYHGLLEHDGFGELRMDMRILKRGQKEVIIHCGKQYRFIVDCSKPHGEEMNMTPEQKTNPQERRCFENDQ